MKIARLKMFILFFTIVVGSMMGNEITKTHNLPQNGDNFTKTRISFVAPGDSGKNVVWDFSQAQVIDGNTKVFYSVIDDSLINATEYGSLMGEGYNVSSQPYRYGDKELVTLGGLNLSDFGARWLDSPNGTFTTMDPLCEDFQHLSPYLYCAGNPIKYIDPSGMESKAFFYSNQNPLLKKAAKSYRNTPDVQIFAHGNSKGISPIVNEEVVRITEASELVEFISKNYTDFKGITIDSEVVIVLHSCNTGTGEDSFAKKVSEEMKNATIVAPTGKVIVNELFGEVGVFDKDKERKEWVVYKGGKEITRLPSYTQPGSEGNTINIWNYIKMLIYELVK